MFFALALAAAAVLSGVRFYQGPTWSDRVLIFDLLTSIMIAFTILYSISENHKESISLVVVLAILSFVSSMALILFLERSKKRRKQ